MADVVTSIQHAIEVVGKLRALSKKIEEADFKMLLADLSGNLADAKLELANVKGEMASLLSENRSLKAQLESRQQAKPSLDQGAYVFAGEEGHFCTACFDARGKQVRVSELPHAFRRLGHWQCPVCRATLS